MESVQPIAAMMVGLALAALSVGWLWRASSQPGLVEQMERTLTSQEARMDRLRAALDEQQSEIDELRIEVTVGREKMAELHAEMDEWRRGMALVFDQLKAADISPAWQPRERSNRAVRPRSDAPLARRIAAQFNIEEINSLAFDVGVLAEEFGGNTRQARARELVELMGRRGAAYTTALLARVNELRSDL